MSQNEYALLNEQIGGLTRLVNARFENTDDKLEQIHCEAKRTNGRVSKTEEQISAALIERAQNREAQANTSRIIADQGNQIMEIKTQLQDVGFFIRNPKLFLLGLAIIVILLISEISEKVPIGEIIKSPTRTEVSTQTSTQTEIYSPQQ